MSMKKVKKLSLKRKQSSYGSSVLPLNLVPGKDKATPTRRTLNSSNAMYRDVPGPGRAGTYFEPLRFSQSGSVSV